MLVEKEVIGPGTYWYLDQNTGVPRKLTVTPELTKYWHEQGNSMIALGLPIPIPCEHDFDAHPMTPAEQLKSNAGQVKEYRMKGDTLFSVCDIQDEEVARKIPKTIRWTSPWFSSFTDGNGREWKNVISHLALTARPRIHKQSPFPSVAAALSLATQVDWTLDEDMASKKKTLAIPVTKDGFCLSRMGRLVHRSNRLFPAYPLAFSLYSGGAALADDMPPMRKKKGGGEDDLPLDDLDDVPDDGMPDGPDEQPGFSDPKGDVSMEELLCDLLGALGIHCEHSGGEAEFKRALYNAAMSKIHELTNSGNGQGVGDNKNQPNTGSNQTPPNPLIHQEQQPMYMSLEEINKIPDPVMKNIALSMYQENVKLRGELDANAKVSNSLRDSKLKEENAKRTSRVTLLGRMSPRVKADLDAMLALPAMALSMGDGGAVVDPMAQTLAVLEKGLADMPRLLTTDRAAFTEQPQPTDQDALSAEKVDDLADSMARMMGCPPEQKKAS